MFMITVLEENINTKQSEKLEVFIKFFMKDSLI